MLVHFFGKLTIKHTQEVLNASSVSIQAFSSTITASMNHIDEQTKDELKKDWP